MPKGKISDDDILGKKHYRSILKLLEEFDLNYNGLSAGEIFYALSNKSDNKKLEKLFTKTDFNGEKTTLKELSSIKIYLIFNDKIEEKPLIYRGLKEINTPAKLNEKLRFLINKGWIETIGKERYYRYRLTDKYIIDGEKRFLKYMIDSLKDDNIFSNSLFDIMIGNQPKISFFSPQWFLCGISANKIENLSSEEKSELNKIIEKIKDNLSMLANRFNCKEMSFHYRK